VTGGGGWEEREIPACAARFLWSVGDEMKEEGTE
jgi:hypothetical protein